MKDAQIEQKLYDAAVSLLNHRYRRGWGGAAAVYTTSGHIYTSIANESANGAALLCIETGAILEAHKFNENITHCICVVRENPQSPYKVLTPCGICQERLAYWGGEVQVGITTKEELKFVSLRELQPYHWTEAYSSTEIEQWDDEFLDYNFNF